MPKLKYLICLLCITLCLQSSAEEARPIFNSDELKQVIVLDEGRLKPLDTFARNLLLRLSGRSSFEGRSASSWLAELLFDYERTVEDKVFLINNPEIVEALGLEEEKKRRYSYAQLYVVERELRSFAIAAQQKEEKQRSIVESEFIRVSKNLQAYASLATNLEFVRPRDELEGKSLLEFMLAFEKATQEQKQDPEYKKLSKNFANWIRLYNISRQTHLSDKELKFLPLQNEETLLWLDGAAAFISYYEFLRDDLKRMQKIQEAYLQEDQELFDLELKLHKRVARAKLQASKQKLPPIDIESFYNDFAALFKAKLAYGFAFVLMLFFYLTRTLYLEKIAFVLTLTAFVLHGFGLVLRMLIMARPPVTNFYETFVFVAWAAVLFALLMKIFKKKDLALFVSTLLGFALLIVAEKHAMDSDSLSVMTAVLDSNFWLSSHVIVITMGYAAVCLSGLLGHLYLVQVFFEKSKEKLQDTYSMILSTINFGLVFTFLGTMLGGIWADQSWGRFWGWDPKENGALLIVMWLLAILHAKQARIIKEFGVAIASVVAIMVVMLAWFGINLLGVGLHSYGFTQGAASGLYIYFACELLCICLAIFFYKYQAKKT